MRANNVDLAHRSGNTLKSNLVRTRPQNSSEGGVYVIPCANCPKAYIGQTGRSLETRFREHKYAIRRHDTNKAVFKHMFDNSSHSMNWDEAKFVFRSGSVKERLVVESALISKVDNFNIMEGVTSVDPATADIILRLNRNIKDNVPAEIWST